MDIIEIRNLNYRYPTSRELALQNISLQIRQGEVCAVIGASESGKTTLCNALRGFIPRFYKGEMEGDVFIKGENTRDKTIADLSRTVGIVIQNPFNQLSGIAETVYEELAFGLENLGIPVKEIRERVENMLKLLNIESLKDKNPFEISGGQQQIISLASIMVMEPDILVLDEPTSQIDPQSAEEIYQIINLFKEKGTTIVLVEHKMELIAEFADHIILLNKGTVAMEGRPEDILSNPEILNYSVNLPRYACLGLEFKKRGFHLESIPITENQAFFQINQILKRKGEL